MKVLVTGAGGFIGANLSRAALVAGHETVACVDPKGDLWRLHAVRELLNIVAVDLADAESAYRLTLDQRPDVVFHLAAHGAYSWQRDLNRMLAVNVQCTQALLDAVRDLGAALIHAGTSSEYGYKDHAPLETEVARPNSHYAITKLAATNLCQAAAAEHGTRAVTLRLYSVYGEWEEPGRLIPALIRAVQAGGWPPLVDPQTARDFVWIGDVCDAFLIAANAETHEPGAIYNIASGFQTTLAELVSTAADVFEVSSAPVWGSMERRSWDTNVWVGDPGRAERELSWKARTELADGLTQTGKWFEGHPELQTRYG